MWQIPEQIRNRLGAHVGRQRPMVAEEHLLLVLHSPPRPEDHARIGRFFWRAPDGTWSSKDLGGGIASLNKHLDEYEDLITALNRQEEEAKTADDYFQVLEQLTPIHRSARNQCEVIQEARKMCPNYHDVIDVRDRAYAIQRSAELLFNGTKNALDFTVAKRAEEQSQASEQMAISAHRLNLLVAFFFPIATLAAILSVDFETLARILRINVEFLETKGPMIFAGFVLLGIVLGVILTKFIKRPFQKKLRQSQDRKDIH